MKLAVSELPSNASEVFPASSFFTQPNAPAALPSPAEIRGIAAAAGETHWWRPAPVKFPHFGLIVKFGTEILIAEGQCLWAMAHLLPGKVPVPEVYGWCTDGSSVFIYMQLVGGSSGMVEAIRCLEQDPEDPFIGHIGRQPLLDTIFTDTNLSAGGPFPDVKTFHDWLTRTNSKQPDDPRFDPYRLELPDDVPLVFTHGDLHRSNIIVTAIGEGPPRVLAILDWHQSGWYPDYWEYAKARWTTRIGKDEWEVEYLPQILDRHAVYDYWDYFVLCLGV